MMVERTSNQHHCFAQTATRFRSRCFRGWSGTSLSRYFHSKSNEPDPQQPDSSRGQKRPDACSYDELSERREQLQDLLRQVDAERAKQKKTG